MRVCACVKYYFGHLLKDIIFKKTFRIVQFIAE